MATDDLLKQGIATLKAGRKAEAHKLLMQVTQQDERNETAWLWLSGAVDTDEERRTCLENVLAINPNNGVARRGLESLIAKEGVRPLGAVSSLTPRAEPIATPREQPAPRPAAVSAPDVARRKKPRKPPTVRRQPDNSGTKRQHSRQNMVKIARAAALGIILFFVSLVTFPMLVSFFGGEEFYPEESWLLISVFTGVVGFVAGLQIESTKARTK